VTVLEDSPAEEAGLRDDDVIIGLDGDEIRDHRDLSRGLNGLEAGDEVELEILRDGRSEMLTVELGEHPNFFAFAFGDDEDTPFHFSFDMDDLDDRLAELHERLEDMDFGGSFSMDFDGPGRRFLRFGSSKPRLGVQVIQPTPELREHLGSSEDLGVIVGKVLSGMPAENAGVLVGDLIVAVDDQEISDADDLVRALERSAGGEITVEVIRDGRTVMLEAVLAEEDDDEFRGPARRMRQPLKPRIPSEKA
jgi:membrane-associated protease RseP (regulator of RpoE activity)